jgi:fatty-acyl-CoA synthase
MNALKAWTRAIQATQHAKGLTLPSLLEQSALGHGGRWALIGPDMALTYADLVGRVNRYARWARAMDLTGRCIGLLMPNSAEYAAIWLGLTRAGCRVALLNTNLRGDALRHCLAAADARGVIAADPGLIPDESVVVWSRESLSSDLGSYSAAPLAFPPPDDSELALLIYTSGTTGLPKAAKVTHARITDWSTWFAAMMNAGPADRLYDCLPMYHSVGGIVAIGAMLVSGGSVVIREKFSASRFWPDIVQSQCTIFQYIGELCRYLTLTEPCGSERRHRLRLAVGNGLQADVWPGFRDRFGIPEILEFYAATEGNVTLYNCEGQVGSIGRVPRVLEPYFSIRLIRIDVETGEPVRGPDGFCVACGPDEPGEAVGLISDNRTFNGYSDAAASDRKILRDAFAAGDRWFRTGDLMRRDAAGFYYFLDRLGDTFRWKGENVSTTGVASVVAGYPGITGAAVYGVVVKGHEGKAGMAAITIDAGFDPNGFPSYLADRLPGYARPLFVRVCSSLDTTNTFKLVKGRLQAEGYLASSDPVWIIKEGRMVAFNPPHPSVPG